ncbi:hypothetical protein PUMCH_000985 [Australozyma saopauloensis]|uniref:Protein arginine N-methyltransferase n=1 Tax=Australozyma saopauloensis TaxID=291208 RepID=A0AAX4H583_9ASCO|nr:hypothetical protein PUMCH_000985 [[Candida] saopauloensis]
MGYGIIIEDADCLLRANFYVPIVGFESSCYSSHVYIRSEILDASITLLDISRNLSSKTTLILDLPIGFLIAKFVTLLRDVPQKIVVVVPIEENLEYWCSLRDEMHLLESLDVDLILRYHESISLEYLSRYKCLEYIGIIPLVIDSKTINFLLSKPQLPHLLIFQSVAQTESFQYWRTLACPNRQKGLDYIIDPLQPLSVDMNLDVYDTFAEDIVKYEQYDCAIEMAIGDLRRKHTAMKILIVGAGRGPFLRSVINHARKTDHITVIEKNLKCIESLQVIIADRTNIELCCMDVREYHDLKSFNLVISELLGSFGCNEASPEILQVFAKSEAIMIPQSYASYVQPIYTGLKKISKLNRPYLTQLSSYIPIDCPKLAFEFQHPSNNRLSQQVNLSFKGPHREIANAFYGYFEATLYGPYKIGNTPRLSCHEKCRSWFPMIFPIEKQTMPIDLTLSRMSDLILTYEWKVNGRLYPRKFEAVKPYEVQLQ